MSSILVIERYRMLQQAFALSMPEGHSVRFAPTLGEAGALAQVDVLVVDAFSPQESDAPSAGDVRLIESGKMPILWIARDGAAAPAARAGLIVLKPPIRREELQKSLAQCLERLGDKSPEPATSKSKAQEAKNRKQPQTAPESNVLPQVIELVEVVEEVAAEDAST